MDQRYLRRADYEHPLRAVHYHRIPRCHPRARKAKAHHRRDFKSLRQDGHVRSAIQTLVIDTQLQMSIPLQTNVVIPPPSPPPPPASITISKPKIAFDVNVQSSTENRISLGDIKPSEKKSHVVVIRNTGDVKLDFTATVTGHSLFVSLLRLNNQLWNLYSQRLHKNQDVNVDVSLEVPIGYTDAGQKNGELIFWARP